MASSSMQESAHDTPGPSGITLPGNSTRPTLRNLRLNDEWMIGEPIPREYERHAAIYSILVSETGQSAEDLEAHVFALDDTEPKLRKHRQRCIKRMEGRTRLKLEINKVTIIVITTSQTENTVVLEPRPEPHSLNHDGQHEISSEHISIGKTRKRTLYQRESQRIQQKERRRAKRRVKTPQYGGRNGDSGHNIAETIDQTGLLDDKNELSMFMPLLRELLDACDLWRAMPFVYLNPAKALGKTLVQAAAALQTAEEMESYLKVRRSEIISLRRHQAKFSSAMKYHLDKLVNMKRGTFENDEENNLSKLSAHGPKPELEVRLKLVTFEGLASEIIDNLLVPCKFVVRLVERKLLEVTHGGLQGRREDLERQFPWYKDPMNLSYPQRAPTFEDVLRLMEWAKVGGCST